MKTHLLTIVSIFLIYTKSNCQSVVGEVMRENKEYRNEKSNFQKSSSKENSKEKSGTEKFCDGALERKRADEQVDKHWGFRMATFDKQPATTWQEIGCDIAYGKNNKNDKSTNSNSKSNEISLPSISHEGNNISIREEVEKVQPYIPPPPPVHNIKNENDNLNEEPPKPYSR